jgi:hypothetical protein
MSDPAIKVERDGAIDGYPLTIVFSSNMNVGTCGCAALAGGETKRIAPFQLLAKLGFSIWGNV